MVKGLGVCYHTGTEKGDAYITYEHGTLQVGVSASCESPVEATVDRIIP